jgi:hypothetical protein
VLEGITTKALLIPPVSPIHMLIACSIKMMHHLTLAVVLRHGCTVQFCDQKPSWQAILVRRQLTISQANLLFEFWGWELSVRIFNQQPPE